MKKTMHIQRLIAICKKHSVAIEEKGNNIFATSPVFLVHTNETINERFALTEKTTLDELFTWLGY